MSWPVSLFLPDLLAVESGLEGRASRFQTLTPTWSPQGSFKELVYVFFMVKDAGLTPDLLSYAAALQCLGRLDQNPSTIQRCVGGRVSWRGLDPLLQSRGHLVLSLVPRVCAHRVPLQVSGPDGPGRAAATGALQWCATVPRGAGRGPEGRAQGPARVQPAATTAAAPAPGQHLATAQGDLCQGEQTLTPTGGAPCRGGVEPGLSLGGLPGASASPSLILSATWIPALPSLLLRGQTSQTWQLLALSKVLTRPCRCRFPSRRCRSRQSQRSAS